jgi:hypothetical protein
MSSPIQRKEAELLQMNTIQSGDLLVWTVYERPTDYPDHYIARPFATRGGERPLQVHLQAPSVEELRDKLPHGLVRLERMEGDDPVIVETWL